MLVTISDKLAALTQLNMSARGIQWIQCEKVLRALPEDTGTRAHTSSGQESRASHSPSAVLRKWRGTSFEKLGPPP